MMTDTRTGMGAGKGAGTGARLEREVEGGRAEPWNLRSNRRGNRGNIGNRGGMENAREGATPTINSNRNSNTVVIVKVIIFVTSSHSPY